jgi:hypothetical protein
MSCTYIQQKHSFRYRLLLYERKFGQEHHRDPQRDPRHFVHLEVGACGAKQQREQIKQFCSALARMPRSSMHRVPFGAFVENHEACVRRRLRD